MSVQRERAYLARTGAANTLPPAYLLALSGGGDDGAFGAGLLVGWSARGTRPKFKVVTGISAGALAAPFAFLGSGYDDVLREVYTGIGPPNVFTRRSFLAAISDDAMTNSAPLAQMISRYVNDDVVAQLADEYGKGRLLLIATTNLDAGQPVIWNIGAIAHSHDPRARELICKILLASASIPAVFPPVLFDVEVDGQIYQEMHVDGGAIAQTFLYPPGLTAVVKKRRRVAYIIRNGRFSVGWKQVDRSTLAIAGRAVSTLTASDGIGDIYRIYATTKRDGVEFNLAHIGDEFTVPYKGPFDPGYMNALFDYGFERARSGYDWDKSAPGFARPIISRESKRS